MSRTLPPERRAFLERRHRELDAELRALEHRCAREGGFVVGMPDELRLRSVGDEYDEVDSALLDDELAYLDAEEDPGDRDQI